MSYTPVVKNRDGYARHAAPESIRANMKRVEAAIRTARSEYRFLEGLLRDRESGIWPGLPVPMGDGNI